MRTIERDRLYTQHCVNKPNPRPFAQPHLPSRQKPQRFQLLEKHYFLKLTPPQNPLLTTLCLCCIQNIKQPVLTDVKFPERYINDLFLLVCSVFICKLYRSINNHPYAIHHLTTNGMLMFCRWKYTIPSTLTHTKHGHKQWSTLG